MEILPWAICVLLLTVVVVLGFKLGFVYRGMTQLERMISERMEEDTNTGIFLSSGNRRTRRLAAVLDVQLKQIRKEHIRYVRGDMELKMAITNISHDLRTPLTAVCGYLELLKREIRERNAGRAAGEYLAVIENRIDALKELMEEFFQYSATVSKETCIVREELSLNAVLEESIAGFYGVFKEAGIEPQIVLPEKEVLRCLNRRALSRILSNLIGNAVKYSGGDFFVRLSEDGELQFKNSAPGLSQAEAGRLFERFYTAGQFESSFQTTDLEDSRAGLPMYTGYKNATGLGLSIAKALTEEMGGQITAACEDETLRITLKF